MNRSITMLMLLVSVTACSPDETKTYSIDKEKVPETGQPTAVVKEAQSDLAKLGSMEIGEPELWMHKEQVADGLDQRPTFYVRADSAQADVEAGMHYRLVKPRAIIYDDDKDEIALTADTGDFDGEAEKATLRGNVLVESVDIEFTMNVITWDNITGLASSDEQSTLNSEMADLTAERLVINPKTNEVKMFNVEGTIKMRGLH